MKPTLKTFAITAGLLILATVAVATAPVAAPTTNPTRQPAILTNIGGTQWNTLYTLEYTDRLGRAHSCIISETREFAFVPTSIACPN